MGKHLGAEHPAVARSLLGLANLLQDQGNHEQVDALYQRALSIREKRLGVRHPLTQEARMVYAEFLRDIGRETEAAELETNNE